MTREKFFEESLRELESCSSFDELTRKCKELHEGCQKFIMQYEYEASIMNTGLPIDEDALELYPADNPQHCVLYPIKVRADGNSLPYTGSIHGFGNESKGKRCESELLLRLY